MRDFIQYELQHFDGGDAQVSVFINGRVAYRRSVEGASRLNVDADGTLDVTPLAEMWAKEEGSLNGADRNQGVPRTVREDLEAAAQDGQPRALLIHTSMGLHVSIALSVKPSTGQKVHIYTDINRREVRLLDLDDGMVQSESEGAMLAVLPMDGMADFTKRSLGITRRDR